MTDAGRITTLEAEPGQDVFVFPLSFAQQRLWFLDQLFPGNPFYNMPGAVRMLGELDEVALRRTFDEILARHEILRTTFVSIDGQPVQVIAPALTLELPMLDLRELAPPEREARARELACKEARRLFALNRGPLVRVRLLRLAEADHVLVVNMHHIVSDGWSLGLFVEEVAALYPAFRAGGGSPLPPLAIQYADFAQWQRDWLQGEVLERHRAYWRRQLADLSPVLNLPTDKARPAVQSFRGASCPALVGKSLTESLRKVGRQAGATLFMTLLAVLEVLLHRYTRQQDFAVGSPVANRNSG